MTPENKAAENGHEQPDDKAVPSLSTLEAAEYVLRVAQRALGSKDIAREVMKLKSTTLGGRTPWKTVNARISTDIIKLGIKSRFKRTAQGFFALREWVDEAEFVVKRRRIKSIDESIKVVPKDMFCDYIKDVETTGLVERDYWPLVLMSIDLPRIDAENTEEFVQLIPTFVVVKHRSILSYVRTKRLPEARLHNKRSISFGGHLQADDNPVLFSEDHKIQRDFLFRELYEEIKFTSDFDANYLGLICLRNNEFERQHAGIVFLIDLPDETDFESLEPGMHVDVRFIPLEELMIDKENMDSWTRLLIEIINELV
jgi:predicted NUDIX family phosphoesterase